MTELCTAYCATGFVVHPLADMPHDEGRIAGKAAVRYVMALAGSTPQVDETQINTLRDEIFKPLANHAIGRHEIVAGSVAPSYISPLHGLQRLEKIMDEYVGGISTQYMTSEPMLDRGLELLTMLKEDLDHIGAEDLHQLQRTWELNHRVWTSEAVLRHTLYRQETRWPGYYYRGDFPMLDDAEWHAFTASRYDAKTGEWQMSKLPVHHIIS
jgi:adenylylsulfate reductase subunit A